MPQLSRTERNAKVDDLLDKVKTCWRNKHNTPDFQGENLPALGRAKRTIRPILKEHIQAYTDVIESLPKTLRPTAEAFFIEGLAELVSDPVRRNLYGPKTNAVLRVANSGLVKYPTATIGALAGLSLLLAGAAVATVTLPIAERINRARGGTGLMNAWNESQLRASLDVLNTKITRKAAQISGTTPMGTASDEAVRGFVEEFIKPELNTRSIPSLTDLALQGLVQQYLAASEEQRKSILSDDKVITVVEQYLHKTAVLAAVVPAAVPVAPADIQAAPAVAPAHAPAQEPAAVAPAVIAPIPAAAPKPSLFRLILEDMVSSAKEPNAVNSIANTMRSRVMDLRTDPPLLGAPPLLDLPLFYDPNPGFYSLSSDGYLVEHYPVTSPGAAGANSPPAQHLGNLVIGNHDDDRKTPDSSTSATPRSRTDSDTEVTPSLWSARFGKSGTDDHGLQPSPAYLRKTGRQTGLDESKVATPPPSPGGRS